MSREEITILKDRAVKAYERAQEAYQAKDYDWSIFLLEQAAQLLVKYFLALKTGYFPRTHSLIRLLEEASYINQEFKDYIKEHRDTLLALEDAYIRARYLPSSYASEDVENKFDLFKKLLRLVEKHESH